MDVGRPRSFDEGQVLDAATAVFRRLGYEGASVDDLVTGVELHRGSLYKAFGSKRGLFVTCLRRLVGDELPRTVAAHGPGAAVDGDALDLVLVAALELAAGDPEVNALVTQAVRLLGDQPAAVLGGRLLTRARVTPDAVERTT